MLEHHLGLEGLALVGLLVGERVAGLPLPDLLHPCAAVGLGLLAAKGVDGLHQLLDHQPAVADDGHLRPLHLVQLGRVDVDVDDLGIRREGETLPVTRSSKRDPRAISRSHFCMEVTAV